MSCNILVIVLDSVRRDRLAPYSARELTPNLRRFADEAVVYRECISSAPWTPPSHASLFTGRYPAHHRCWGYPSILDDDLVTAAEWFAQAGYQCVGASCNPHIRYRSAGDFSRGLARGFHRFADLWDPWYLYLPLLLAQRVESLPELNRWIKGGFRRLLPKRSSEKGGRKAVDFLARSLKDTKKPFFAFLNLMEAHLPYTSPSRFQRDHLKEVPSRQVKRFNSSPAAFWEYISGRRSLSRSEKSQIAGLYDAAVSYQDWLLGSLFGRFPQDVWDATLVAVLSDHGEHLGEHGLYNHSVSLYEELIHVPLLIKYPKELRLTGEEKSPVQNVDLLPTFIEAAQIAPPPSQELDGQSLLDRDLPRGRWTYSELAAFPESFWHAHPELPREEYDTYMITVRKAHQKLIHREEEHLADEWLDLQADPKEENNRLLQASLNELKPFYGRIRAFRSGDSTTSGESSDFHDPLIEERLKALGYL